MLQLILSSRRILEADVTETKAARWQASKLRRANRGLALVKATDFTCAAEIDTFTLTRRAIYLLLVHREKGIEYVRFSFRIQFTDDLNRCALSECFHNHNRGRRLCFASPPSISAQNLTTKARSNASKTPDSPKLPCVQTEDKPNQNLFRPVLNRNPVSNASAASEPSKFLVSLSVFLSRRLNSCADLLCV